jgi:hypothetical protein
MACPKISSSRRETMITDNIKTLIATNTLFFSIKKNCLIDLLEFIKNEKVKLIEIV